MTKLDTLFSDHAALGQQGGGGGSIHDKKEIAHIFCFRSAIPITALVQHDSTIGNKCVEFFTLGQCDAKSARVLSPLHYMFG